MDERPDDAPPTAEEIQESVISVADDAALLGVIAELFPPMFGVDLVPVPEGALAVETEVGTLFVGVLSDFVVSLELRLEGVFHVSLELLEYLNEQNASSAFVTFSVLDERVWVSGSVDGRPLVSMHLARVVTYMFQAATALASEVTPETPR